MRYGIPLLGQFERWSNPVGIAAFFQLNQSLTVTHTSKGPASATAEKANIALEIIRILLRIDYNLLGPHMSDVFTVLLMVRHPLDESG